ncbi:hypothetical protein DC20_16565 [Rufibacter tibetensis]|uniref:Uncharacterized protein n=2 Tax=Rufibacter tibetensis TaxID=512763 RepID=A0A0P0CL37_9BACT|nr:hypothetical protein DC20_16565 [Rufibacter tibetensis]
MENGKKTWVSHPTKKQLVLVVVVWVICVGLMVMAMTDFFRQSLFSRGNLVFLLLMVTSTFMVIGFCLNYLRSKLE